VTKVLIDPSTKITYGIEFLRNRKRYRVVARKEVILSAGTFSSPQLLMLSGVGDQNDLRRIGVPLVQNLPVGKIMYDHVTLIGLTFIANTSGVSLNTDRTMEPTNVVQFLRGEGILTVPGGVEALSFIKTKISDNRGPDVPDIELIFIPGGYHSDQGTGIRTGMGISDKIYNSVYKELEDTAIDTFSISQMLFHPKSVGYMELKSSNPFHWPKFYHNYFQHPDDVETILEGIKYSLQLVKTPPFQKVGARLHSKPLPNCAHLHFASDDYFRCMIRTLSSSLHHQTATCNFFCIKYKIVILSKYQIFWHR
jgi:choline dehydrogenase-like flavoprotein